MKAPIFQILIVLFGTGLSSASYAKDRAIIFGGNCEYAGGNAKPKNQFFDEFKSTAERLSEAGWETEIYFAGKTRECELEASDPVCQQNPGQLICCPNGVDPKFWSKKYLLENLPGHSASDATTENLFSALSRAAQDLRPGDQLLLDVIDHGGRNFTDPNQHTWCMADDEKSLAINDMGLLLLLETLKKREIKIGVIDGSCFSGASVKVLEPYGCVLSAQHSSFEAEARDESSISSGLFDILNPAPGRKPVGISSRYTFDDLYLSVLSENRSAIATTNVPQYSGIDKNNSSLDFSQISSDNTGTTEMGPTPGVRANTKAFVDEYKQLKTPASIELKAWNISAEIAHFQSQPPESGEVKLASLLVDPDSYPHALPDLRALYSRFGKQLSDIDKKINQLDLSYKRRDGLIQSLQSHKFTVDISIIPNAIREDVLWRFGPSTTSGGPGGIEILTLDATQFPWADSIADKVNAVMSEYSPQAQQPSGYSVAQLKSDLITTFENLNTSVTQDELKTILDSRKQLNEINLNLEQVEADLTNAQNASFKDYMVLKIVDFLEIPTETKSSPCSEFYFSEPK